MIMTLKKQKQKGYKPFQKKTLQIIAVESKNNKKSI